MKKGKAWKPNTHPCTHIDENKHNESLKTLYMYCQHMRIVFGNQLEVSRFAIKAVNLAINVSWLMNRLGYNCDNYVNKKIDVLSFWTYYM